MHLPERSFRSRPGRQAGKLLPVDDGALSGSVCYLSRIEAPLRASLASIILSRWWPKRRRSAAIAYRRRHYAGARSSATLSMPKMVQVRRSLMPNSMPGMHPLATPSAAVLLQHLQLARLRHLHPAVLGLPRVRCRAADPELRHTSAVFIPLPWSRNTAMICPCGTQAFFTSVSSQRKRAPAHPGGVARKDVTVVRSCRVSSRDRESGGGPFSRRSQRSSTRSGAPDPYAGRASSGDARTCRVCRTRWWCR